MALFLENIGPSDELRRQIAMTDISPTTITVILDTPRTLQVVHKTATPSQLIVRCKDERDTIILHLPYEQDARASATIISYDKED